MEIAIAGASPKENAFSISPAVEASDRLGRSWPPPVMIVPCKRMTGTVTASERMDFGKRRLRMRINEKSPSVHVGISWPCAMPQMRMSIAENCGAAVVDGVGLRGEQVSVSAVQNERRHQLEASARAANRANDDADRRSRAASLDRQDPGGAEAAIECSENG